MSVLPDVPYQPDMVVCPLCHGRQMVMYRTEGWATMARHLANGEWCPQVEVPAPSDRARTIDEAMPWNAVSDDDDTDREGE